MAFGSIRRTQTALPGYYYLMLLVILIWNRCVALGSTYVSSWHHIPASRVLRQPSRVGPNIWQTTS